MEGNVVNNGAATPQRPRAATSAGGADEVVRWDSCRLDFFGTFLVKQKSTEKVRGFTGHEHYPQFKIINMNGRLYDPIICRFFSPDNFVQLPEETQSFNRYSYCLNNPLKYTDPTGQILVIAGNQANLSFNQLQSFTNLSLTRNDNGMISITGDIPSKLNSRDQWLMSICNNQKITVNITATDGNIGNSDGGAFWGNTVSFYNEGNSTGQVDNPLMHYLNVKGVSTNQKVNPIKNYILDSFGERGQTIFHEITESFLGGVYSMIFGKSALKAERGNETYNTIADPAHNNAYPHPILDEKQIKDFDRLKQTVDKIKELYNNKIW